MLTVFMATRNGEGTLPSVLEAFTRLQSPNSGWKLVVVDNGSTDRTREIVTAFQARLPLAYEFEPKPGKNAALNTGLAYLEGDLAVFTDDDVFPREDWLVRLRKAADSQPFYTMFGGVVLPRWEVSPPEWLSWAPPGPVYTLTDPEISDGTTLPALVFGPNMAIRAHIFQSGIRFDTSIGPQGAAYAMGSETELTERLGRQGHKACHVSAAVVEHFIRKYQMEKSWVFRRAVRYGRGHFRRARAEDPSVYPNFLGLPLRLAVKLVKPSFRIAAASLRSDDRKVFSARWDFHFLLGYVIEAFFVGRDAQSNGERLACSS